MSITTQLLALADTLEAEGATLAVEGLREAVDIIDHHNDLLDELDTAQRELEEERTGHQTTMKALQQYQDAVGRLMDIIPPGDAAAMGDRARMRNYASPPGSSYHQMMTFDPQSGMAQYSVPLKP